LNKEEIALFLLGSAVDGFLKSVITGTFTLLVFDFLNKNKKII
jgi:hypothetical protein